LEQPDWLFPAVEIPGALSEVYMIKKDNADTDMFRSILNALPAVVFVVDDDVTIHDYNAAASDFLSAPEPAIIKRRGGEALHCIHSNDVPGGCGRGPACMDCVIRSSVAQAFQGNRVVRRRTRLKVNHDGGVREIYSLITASPFLYKGSPYVLLVIEDISEIAELQRMIPICSICRKVRDDTQSWFRVEAYFKEHWDVDFSHGLCPECYKIEMDKMTKKL